MEGESTMLDSSVTLGQNQREIIDYMREAYHIEDIKIRPGGKHIHVEYVYQGRRIKDTLPRHGKSGDPNWVEVRKHDLRRTLGDPPPPPAPKPTRTLEEMTQALQEKVDLKAGTAMSAVIDPGRMKATITAATGKSTTPTPVLQRRFPCTVASYSTSIWLSLGAELCAAISDAFSPEKYRFTVSFVYPGTWVVRPIPVKNGTGRAIETDKHRLRGTSTDTVKQLGEFRATRAEAVIFGRRVEFRLLEKPEITAPPAAPEEAPQPEPVVEAVGSTAVITSVIPVEPPSRPVEPPPAPPIPPADPRERLRAVLRAIKDIEDEGTYQLINSYGWRWRAADIGLEDE